MIRTPGTLLYAQAHLSCFVVDCREPIHKAVETSESEWLGICIRHMMYGEKFHCIGDNFDGHTMCGRNAKDNRIVASSDVTCGTCQRINDGS